MRLLENLYPFSQIAIGLDRLVPRVHVPWCHFFDHPKKLNQQLCASRGTFKTTLMEADVLRDALRWPGYKQLVNSMTQELAEIKVGEIKLWCETRPVLKTLYGDLLPQDRRVRWSRKFLQFANGSIIVGAGIGTRTQGLHFHKQVEDDTIGPKKDDVSGDDFMPGPEDIRKAIAHHEQSFYLGEHYGTYRRIVLNTRWAPDDLIAYQREKERAFTQFFEFCVVGPHGEARFPEQWSEDALERDRVRSPYLHASQVLLQPIPAGRLTFKEGSIRPFGIDPKVKRADCKLCIAILDPCGLSEARATSDWAIVIVGIDEDNVWWVLGSHTGRSFEHKKVSDLIFELDEVFQFTTFGIEKNIEETFGGVMIDEVRKRGHPIPIQLFPAGVRSKDDRIGSIAPRAQYGMLRVHESCRKLLDHMRTHPMGGMTHYDDLDALAHVRRFAPLTALSEQEEDPEPALIRILDESGRELQPGEPIPAKHRTVMDYGVFLDERLEKKIRQREERDHVRSA